MSWNKISQNGKEVWVNKSHRAAGKGFIVFCAEGHINEAEIHDLSRIGGYDPAGYGPVYRVEKTTSPESGKKATVWRTNASSN